MRDSQKKKKKMRTVLYTIGGEERCVHCIQSRAPGEYGGERAAEGDERRSVTVEDDGQRWEHQKDAAGGGSDGESIARARGRRKRQGQVEVAPHDVGQPRHGGEQPPRASKPSGRRNGRDRPAF